MKHILHEDITYDTQPPPPPTPKRTPSRHIQHLHTTTLYHIRYTAHPHITHSTPSHHTQHTLTSHTAHPHITHSTPSHHTQHTLTPHCTNSLGALGTSTVVFCHNVRNALKCATTCKIFCKQKCSRMQFICKICENYCL